MCLAICFTFLLGATFSRADEIVVGYTGPLSGPAAEYGQDILNGVDLGGESSDVSSILIDLTQRETRAFSNRFARTLVNEMKTVARMHKHPLKSAGFKVLKAHDVPSVLVELGYVSNKDDLQHLVSESWRSRTVGSVAQAVDAFLGKRVVSAGASK